MSGPQNSRFGEQQMCSVARKGTLNQTSRARILGLFDPRGRRVTHPITVMQVEGRSTVAAKSDRRREGCGMTQVWDEPERPFPVTGGPSCQSSARRPGKDPRKEGYKRRAGDLGHEAYFYAFQARTRHTSTRPASRPARNSSSFALMTSRDTKWARRSWTDVLEKGEDDRRDRGL